MKPHSHHSRAGFSLVLSLIILTLLAVLVVGFISTTAVDRVTARAFANKAQAQIAAETAVDTAISLLRENIAQYPDSVTYWEDVDPKGGGLRVEGTMLYYADRAPITSQTTGKPPEPKRYVLPLFSIGVDTNGERLTAVEVAKKTEAFGAAAWTLENSVDLNRPRFAGDKQGWIGASPRLPLAGETADKDTGLVRPPLRAKWVDVKEQNTPGKDARTIGRYAFWIEDESFKVNLNQLGLTKRGTEKVSPGASPSEIPFQGLLRSARAPAALDRDGFATSVFNLRNGFVGKRLLDGRSFNQADGTYLLGDEAKFLATVYSGALNLSRHGSQRLNLNALGFEKTNASDADIEKQIGQVVETIRYHAPKFGQRFYRTTATALNTEQVTAPHQNIYLHKIAANIRDYIDPDLQPTIILSTGKLAPRTAPLLALNGEVEGDANEIWAQGKDSAPFLQEAVARYRSKVTGGRYELKVDYYMEFWNMTNRGFYALPQAGASEPEGLGAGSFLRIANQLWWQAATGGAILKSDNSPPGNPDDSANRAVMVDLGEGVYLNGKAEPRGVYFKPGACTVITTDPEYTTMKSSLGGSSPAFSGGFNPVNVYYCSKHLGNSKREYLGPLPTGANGIKPYFRNGTQDYETEIILGNSRGYFECNAAPIAHGGSAQTTTSGSPRDDWYGGTLLGNGTTVSQLSDPRTNNEQLIYTRFISGASTSEPDQSRYWNQVGSPRFSLGYPNDLYTNPHLSNQWPDYYHGWDKTSSSTAENPNADTAPAVIANAPLASIGQLGDVFDPARLKGTVGSLGIGGSRGGGRSMRIGQQDDRFDGKTANAASRDWASWRLADFLGTSSEVQLPGVININGLRRDNGAALRAASYGMTLRAVSRARSASSTAQVSDKALDSEEKVVTAGLQRVIDQAIKRMTDNDPAKTYVASKPYFGPFAERGELSELEVFSVGTNLLPGVAMSDAFDRTREELVRRLLDLTTTRGSVFTVYAVGQSIAEGPPPKRLQTVTGTHQTKVTFALIPKRTDGSDFRAAAETFDPTKPTAVAERFAKPDHYDIQILQVGS